jgi:ATP-dependent DNA helicase Rep
LLSELHYDEWLKETCRDKKAAERRLENIQELVAWIERLARDPEAETRLPEIVTRLMLFNMLEKGEDDETADQVALMTLHAAKGLEFPHVFIVGVEEGVLPHHQSQDPAGIEEERRLAYVGITRAKLSLTLLHAAQRRRGGEPVTTEPSRFLAELPKEDLDWEKSASPQESQARADAHLENLRSLLRQAPAE